MVFFSFLYSPSRNVRLEEKKILTFVAEYLYDITRYLKMCNSNDLRLKRFSRFGEYARVLCNISTFVQIFFYTRTEKKKKKKILTSIKRSSQCGIVCNGTHVNFFAFQTFTLLLRLFLFAGFSIFD